MMIDQPVTFYPKLKDNKKEHTKAELDAVYDEWKKSHEGEETGRKVSLSELMSKK